MVFIVPFLGNVILQVHLEMICNASCCFYIIVYLQRIILCYQFDVLLKHNNILLKSKTRKLRKNKVYKLTPQYESEQIKKILLESALMIDTLQYARHKSQAVQRITTADLDCKSNQKCILIVKRFEFLLLHTQLFIFIRSIRNQKSINK